MKSKKVLFLFLSIILISIVAFLITSYRQDVKMKITKAEQAQMRTDRATIFSTSTAIAEKVDLIKKLKAMSLDETRDPQFRINAGQTVVSTFFMYGMTLGEGFSSDSFTEREIFDYAKYITSLGDSDRISLLTAYIGLTFYPKEMTKDSVAELLRSYQRYVKLYSDRDACNGSSRFASVLYLAKKNNMDVSQEFGDYYARFDRAFTDACKGDGKIFTGFMWLAAISDIGDSDVEAKKAAELIAFLTSDKSQNAPLVKNLRASYFSTVKEPDTVNIVTRLMFKYPAFRTFIVSIE